MTSQLQADYWDKVCQTKSFSHPVDESIYDLLSLDSRILDYGCGKGRIIQELISRGYHNLIGVESSANMLYEVSKLITSANVTLINNQAIHIPEIANLSVNFAFLFAVLTCTISYDDQKLLIEELARVLQSGGYLYISDYLIQADTLNQNRYKNKMVNNCYGTFKTEDGGVMRHHQEDYFFNLFKDKFEIIWTKSINGTTMNNNSTIITQVLLRKY